MDARDVQWDVRKGHASAVVYVREYQAGGIAGTMCGGGLENCYFAGTVCATAGR